MVTSRLKQAVTPDAAQLASSRLHLGTVHLTPSLHPRLGLPQEAVAAAFAGPGSAIVALHPTPTTIVSARALVAAPVHPVATARRGINFFASNSKQIVPTTMTRSWARRKSAWSRTTRTQRCSPLLHISSPRATMKAFRTHRPFPRALAPRSRRFPILLPLIA